MDLIGKIKFPSKYFHARTVSSNSLKKSQEIILGRMNESQKWMEIMKRFSNTGETGRCPNCGYEENLEVIITEDGLGSVTFHCKGCNRYTHFDGRRI